MKVELGPVQETLLIPLYGRAMVTQKGGMIHDPKAVEIVRELDYDFDKWKGDSAIVGVCLRTRMYDEEVKRFLAKHPEGTVVEIGCGLNTRFERIDNGTAKWFELDLPDSMAIRRKFFKDEPRRVSIAASALDDDWFETILATGGPYCFVSEAVIIYIDAELLKPMFQNLARCFPGATLIMDTTSAKMVDGQTKAGIMKTMPRESHFRWKCNDPGALEDWGLALQESKTFVDSPPTLVAEMPFVYRFLVKFLPGLMRKQIDGYRINRYKLSI